jgi:prevent-host-death family protein
MIREVQASEAKTHLLRILDEVERGNTIIITRHGRPVARLIPEAERRREEIDKAIQGLRAFGRRTRGLTLQQLLGARHEGHKY